MCGAVDTLPTCLSFLSSFHLNSPGFALPCIVVPRGLLARLYILSNVLCVNSVAVRSNSYMTVAQWTRERSSPTSVIWVRVPALATLLLIFFSSANFFSGYSVFSPLPEINIPKFQFDLESVFR